jgi:hypothetical protein
MSITERNLPADVAPVVMQSVSAEPTRRQALQRWLSARADGASGLAVGVTLALLTLRSQGISGLGDSVAAGVVGGGLTSWLVFMSRARWPMEFRDKKTAMERNNQQAREARQHVFRRRNN